LNWVFIVRVRQKLSNQKAKVKVRELVRADYYTRDNMTLRTPRLIGLENKKVLLIGVGALGSQIAFQLARAGIKELHMVDHDVLQAGNLSRWISAFNYIGIPKVLVAAEIMGLNYPLLKCFPYGYRIGQHENVLFDNETYDSHELTLKLIEEVDIVIDCTAETNVSHYLSYLCNIKQVDYVWATATNGAWGGIVGKSLGKSGHNIWHKFMTKYGDGEIPVPSVESSNLVQTVGCFHPTFTGTGFDLDQISLMASRVVVSVLQSGTEESYPEFDWDVAMVNLWDIKHSKPIAAEWNIYKLDYETS
jgi:hypothetical protein